MRTAVNVKLPSVVLTELVLAAQSPVAADKGELL